MSVASISDTWQMTKKMTTWLATCDKDTVSDQFNSAV